MITARRYHDICTGHRVCNHESKCAHLHGHNYRIHFEVVGIDNPNMQDNLGRVIDFGVIKTHLCDWLEKSWDHKFLIWEHDPWWPDLKNLDQHGVVLVPFNPTAENMAKYLLEVVGPRQLQGLGVRVAKVLIEETAKCHASAEL